MAENESGDASVAWRRATRLASARTFVNNAHLRPRRPTPVLASSLHAPVNLVAMKRVLDVDDDDAASESANAFPCKRLRQLQSALGHRYEKRFVPSYPFHAALEPDEDLPDDQHHHLPDAPPRWLTHVAPDEHSTFVAVFLVLL